MRDCLVFDLDSELDFTPVRSILRGGKDGVNAADFAVSALGAATQAPGSHSTENDALSVRGRRAPK